MAKGKNTFLLFLLVPFFSKQAETISLCSMMFNHLRHRDLDLQDDDVVGGDVDVDADDNDGYERNELAAQHVQNIISCKNTFCLVSVFPGDFVQLAAYRSKTVESTTWVCRSGSSSSNSGSSTLSCCKILLPYHQVNGCHHVPRTNM